MNNIGRASKLCTTTGRRDNHDSAWKGVHAQKKGVEMVVNRHGMCVGGKTGEGRGVMELGGAGGEDPMVMEHARGYHSNNSLPFSFCSKI